MAFSSKFFEMYSKQFTNGRAAVDCDTTTLLKVYEQVVEKIKLKKAFLEQHPMHELRQNTRYYSALSIELCQLQGTEQWLANELKRREEAARV